MKRVSPTDSSASSTSLRRSPRPSGLCRSGSSTLLRTDAHGISERPYSWNTSAISSGGSVTRLPRSTMSPRVGRRSPAAHLSSVVLPQPEGPTTQTNSRSSTTNDTSRSACVSFSPVPYVFARLPISSIRQSSNLGGAPAAMPREQPSLGEEEEDVQHVAEHADQQDCRPHRRELERVLRDQQDVADAVRAREVLGEHHRDHRERDGRPH